ncbi:DUF3016 domain-containing protein [Roseateles saccharophilus]|uniref:DUF3016 family protein n=1 Tax=Roseateles saccharophilus TaxID=304 RepID=A0A4R3VEJ4_ROSSA|nr:DUF3016 domain-containing protein [Roseateles saccharophilus]MDG0832822.1 DUF3016 domain-containing protein [Roseateles saccharophilus]TCV03817.1 DUF3016 family protein [Roseateles saccharophilus]
MTNRWIALGLLALGAAAQADVKVNFVHPEKFSDIRDNDGFSRPEVLKDLEAHMIAEAGKVLPGRDVRFDVTDVDLAGEVEPFGRHGRWLRVMRAVTSPAITLTYEVREGGVLVRQGEAKMRDMDYQNSFNSLTDSDPLRYEKRMFDRWMQSEFNPAAAAARGH